MNNFKKASVKMSAERTELHELLNLSGAEISVNSMPAGAQVLPAAQPLPVRCYLHRIFY